MTATLQTSLLPRYSLESQKSTHHAQKAKPPLLHSTLQEEMLYLKLNP